MCCADAGRRARRQPSERPGHFGRRAVICCRKVRSQSHVGGVKHHELRHASPPSACPTAPPLSAVPNVSVQTPGALLDAHSEALDGGGVSWLRHMHIYIRWTPAVSAAPACFPAGSGPGRCAAAAPAAARVLLLVAHSHAHPHHDGSAAGQPDPAAARVPEPGHPGSHQEVTCQRSHLCVPGHHHALQSR